MSEIEFNLLDEPWIRVMTEDCTSQEISLTQALWEGHHYRRLAGELPTQDVAILRLLLAVLHTVFYRMDLDGEDNLIETPGQAVQRWQMLWKAGTVSTRTDSKIFGTMEGASSRLFHPEHPFSIRLRQHP